MSTKEDIIQAATRLFAEKGYEGMTMKEIANEVGIKPPSVYAFFKSKEDVFMHIYNDILSGHLQITSNNAAEYRTQSAKEELDQLLSSVIEFQLKQSMKMKILLRLMLFPPDFVVDDAKAEFLKVEKKEHEILCTVFKKGMENGEIKEGDCSALASFLICIMDGLFWEMQRHDEAAFRERFEVIWRQFWEGIKK